MQARHAQKVQNCGILSITKGFWQLDNASWSCFHNSDSGRSGEVVCRHSLHLSHYWVMTLSCIPCTMHLVQYLPVVSFQWEYINPHSTMHNDTAWLWWSILLWTPYLLHPQLGSAGQGGSCIHPVLYCQPCMQSIKVRGHFQTIFEKLASLWR